MRILLGLDGSQASLAALELVMRTDWPNGTIIRLVGAYELTADWIGLPAAIAPDADGDHERQQTLFDGLQALAALVMRGHVPARQRRPIRLPAAVAG